MEAKAAALEARTKAER